MLVPSPHGLATLQLLTPPLEVEFGVAYHVISQVFQIILRAAARSEKVSRLEGK